MMMMINCRRGRLLALLPPSVEVEQSPNNLREPPCHYSKVESDRWGGPPEGTSESHHGGGAPRTHTHAHTRHHPGRQDHRGCAAPAQRAHASRHQRRCHHPRAAFTERGRAAARDAEDFVGVVQVPHHLPKEVPRRSSAPRRGVRELLKREDALFGHPLLPPHHGRGGRGGERSDLDGDDPGPREPGGPTAEGAAEQRRGTRRRCRSGSLSGFFEVIVASEPSES
mmetsp:Transcript_28024/g.52359  ORF Transcript_28024/g.52359 Transcript_28024/m.52359 type:complete len:225 (-) Transcript_28024:190-864(-)